MVTVDCSFYRVPGASKTCFHYFKIILNTESQNMLALPIRFFSTYYVTSSLTPTGPHGPAELLLEPIDKHFQIYVLYVLHFHSNARKKSDIMGFDFWQFLTVITIGLAQIFPLWKCIARNRTRFFWSTIPSAQPKKGEMWLVTFFNFNFSFSIGDNCQTSHFSS